MPKIFGFEFNRSQKHATKPTVTPSATSVTVPSDTLETQPSLPLNRSFPRKAIGDSGTRGIRGIITEEYNSQLQGIQGIKVFDEMRKSDGTVRAALLAMTLPVVRAKWFINPATEDQNDKDVANFCEHALFDWLDTSWDDIVRQALLSVPFGVMVFEKVYGVKDHEGKSYITINKLAPRLPKSIQQWELPDKTFGIQQIRQDGQVALIPGSKLLIFVNEREGNNWWGNSMIRPAYKHWYYKNKFYQIDAMAFERQGMGVPMIKMPAGYTESDEAKAAQAAQNLRANESAFLLLPDGYSAEFMDMGSGTTRDPQNSINHHNKQILQSCLAQFLELGAASGGGSRALSEDHSTLFLKAVEALANNIISVINNGLIPELVDFNFDGVTVYPKLDYSGITKSDVAALGTAYSQLVTAGGITPTDADQQYLRAMMGLPARTQDEMDSQEDEEGEDDPDAEEQVDHVDNEDVDEDGAMGDAMKKDPTKQPTAGDKKKVDTAAKDTKKPVTAHVHTKAVRKFDDGKGFKSWRPFTFAEKKVTWKNIEDMMNTLQDGFSTEAKALLNESKDSFMKKLHQAMADGDTKAITDLEVGFINDYKALLKDAMKKAYQYGKTNASKEMNVDAPANTASSLAQIDLLADTISNKLASDIETKAKVSTASALRSDATPLQAAGTIDVALETVITKSVDQASGLIIGQAMNIGRNDVFERNSAMIHALQRSEILDNDTCDFCLSMDGLIVSPDDKWATEGEFHTNCRGIWVEILKDEVQLPEVTGVPENLGDYYGGEPNALVQPPKPIVRPGSPAADEAARRADAKNAKKKK